MSVQVNIEEYENILKTHDWTYQYSDDPSVYARGAGSLQKIHKHKNTTPKHQELFIKYHKDVEMLN